MTKQGETQPARAIVFGSRRSQLAMWQTRTVADQLASRHPSLSCSINQYQTRGDQELSQALPEIGGKGLFTAELDAAIRMGEIHIAVHSLKDLPTQSEAEISIIPILSREDPRDVLISKNDVKLADLPAGAIIGTSSPRRASQLLALRPDLVVRSVRGNVPTRVSKAKSGEFDAVVLAAAGVKRVGLEAEIAEYFSFDQMLPAPGQGAIAATCKSTDTDTLRLVHSIADSATQRCVAAERFFLQFLGGGCSAPIAAFATQSNEEIELTGRVASLDGQRLVTDSMSGRDPEKLARDLANRIRSQGADQILAETFPLANQTVLITRAQEQSKELAATLTSKGANVVSIPLIEFHAWHSEDSAKQVIDPLNSFDWILFTSANGVRFFHDRLQQAGIEMPTDAVKPQIASVGPTTTKVLEKLGYRVDFVPSQFESRALGEQLELEPGERVLIPCPKNHSQLLSKTLRDRGGEVLMWPIYETQPTQLSSSQQSELGSEFDAILFASPSAVTSYFKNLDDVQSPSEKTTVVCIGPTTQQKMNERGIKSFLPDEATTTAMVELLVRHARPGDDA